MFLFGDLNVNHKDWLTYSAGKDRLVNSACNFSISNDLIKMVNFPTYIPGCDSRNPALLDFFFFFAYDASIFVMQWLSFL